MNIWIPVGFSIFTFLFYQAWCRGLLADWGRTGVPLWVAIAGAACSVGTWSIYLYTHLIWI